MGNCYAEIHLPELSSIESMKYRQSVKSGFCNRGSIEESGLEDNPHVYLSQPIRVVFGFFTAIHVFNRLFVEIGVGWRTFGYYLEEGNLDFNAVLDSLP